MFLESTSLKRGTLFLNLEILAGMPLHRRYRYRQFFPPTDCETAAAQAAYRSERLGVRGRRRRRRRAAPRRGLARPPAFLDGDHQEDDDAPEYDSLSEDAAETFQGTLNSGGSQRQWRQAIQQKAAAWDRAMPVLLDAALEQTKENADYLRSRQEAQTGALKQRIADFSQAACNAAASHETAPGAQLSGERCITYCTTDFAATVMIPSFSSEGGELEMPASAAFCFPSSGEQPHVWFDISVLQLFAQQFMLAGVSIAGFCSSLESAQQEVQKIMLNHEELPKWSQSQFSSAYFQYLSHLQQLRRATLGAAADQLYPGAFGYCPPCADSNISGQEPQEQEVLRHADATLRKAQLALDGINLAQLPHAPTEDVHQQILPHLAAHSLQEHVRPTALDGGHSDEPDGPVDQPEEHAACTIGSDEPHEAEPRSGQCQSLLVGPKRPLTITMDGNQKLNHYEKCGRVLNEIQEATFDGRADQKHSFFGPLERVHEE